METSQTAPNQYRMADNSSLLYVEMRLCNLTMNRIERVLLHNVHKPKDIRSISWMFLLYGSSQRLTVHFDTKQTV